MSGIIIFFSFKLPSRQLFLLLTLFIGALLFTWHQVLPPRHVPVEAVLPLTGLIIAVDPGHGGYDPGSTSNGVLEKDVVLEIALYLRDYLQQGGARIILTREEDKDFLEATAGPKKRLDFSNRLQIVEDAAADLLISLHANCIASPRWRGSQVFYQKGCDEGQGLAECIQLELSRVLENTDRLAQSGNYYLLRESSMCGVVVEVGFLSNPQEAALLQKADYQKKVAWAIYLGIVAYFSTT